MEASVPLNQWFRLCTLPILFTAIFFSVYSLLQINLNFIADLIADLS
ncbi:MAG: hypothetical protein ACK48D_20455 [Pseudanabaena sp.]|jgi:hypothetical protein